QGRYLLLARHGEAVSEEEGLTERGLRQAALLGERLKGVPLERVWHSPLARGAETARLVAERLGGVPLTVEEAAGDYVPYVPEREELPQDSAGLLLRFLGQVTEAERTGGARLAAEAERLFTGVTEGEADRYELVVTHSFLVAWLVRAALDTPKWRWIGLNHCNAALTVIRYTPGRPVSVMLWNDMAHLPEELRWTGFPAGARI
ncbi:histidine phosphatase family protein, partial [Streptomyces sp. GC420]|uniref:histidine phosphatase family protein n=1 Tax=Streptomyces sp. GC420 TaxID=2697568 RepID=UPI001414D543